MSEAMSTFLRKAVAKQQVVKRTDDTEILGQAVSNKDTTEVHQEAKFLVNELQGRQGVPGDMRIKVADFKGISYYWTNEW